MEKISTIIDKHRFQLYESSGGNQVDGLPPALSALRVITLVEHSEYALRVIYQFFSIIVDPRTKILRRVLRTTQFL